MDNSSIKSEIANELQEALEELGATYNSSGDGSGVVLSNVKLSDEPLQQIYYGAPGTGKSYEIDRMTKDKNVIRTTFHPDSDYSTFVGAYKPVATDDVKSNELNSSLSIIELQKLYSAYVGQDPKPTRPEITFAGMYWYQLEQVSSADWSLIFTGSAASVVTYEIPKGIAAGKALSSRITKQTKSITYKFVPQAFIKAYVEAWRDLDKPVYLIIEEINRGNCAQIFGDIFQLLDRGNNGRSSYVISPDEDIREFLAEEFEQNGVDANAPQQIKTGRLMQLPENMRIWATMNTSDQSLFPIDSAFKRRWDWKYMPINTKKENWAIEVDNTKYSWTSFLDLINKQIGTTTSSEDKMLGFFFCKAENNVISAERFVSKVLFYIYNDVFKDYGFTTDLFKGESESDKLTFRRYYNMDGTVDETRVALFLKNLGVELFSAAPTSEGDDDDNDEAQEGRADSNHKSIQSITFPDGTVFDTNSMTHVDAYIETLKKIGLDQAAPIIMNSKYRRLGCTLISKTREAAIEANTNYSYRQVGEYYIVKGSSDDTLINLLQLVSDTLHLDLKIAYN